MGFYLEDTDGLRDCGEKPHRGNQIEHGVETKLRNRFFEQGIRKCTPIGKFDRGIVDQLVVGIIENRRLTLIDGIEDFLRDPSR